MRTGNWSPRARPTRSARSGRHAGRRRHVADRRGARRGRAVADGLLRHGGGGRRHDAAAGADPGTAAERHAGGDRDRLFRQSHPAGRVRGHPPRARHGVLVGRRRGRRRARLRHAAGHRRRHHPVRGRAGEPDGAPAGVRDRAQARRGRPATAVARTRRRNDRRPVDPATGRTPVLHERAECRRSDRRPAGAATLRAFSCST